MASLKKRGKSYSIKFVRSINGEREEKTIALGTNWKEVAVKKQKKLEVLFNENQINPFSPDFDVDQVLRPEKTKVAPQNIQSAFDLFLKTKNHLRPATIVAYKRNIQQWLNYTNSSKIRINRIDQEALRNYLYRKEANQVTAQTNAKHITTFFKWMIKKGWMKSNPLDDIDLQKPEVNYFDKMLTKEELVRLFKTFDKYHIQESKKSYYREYMRQEWFKPLIATYFYTGLRLHEAAYSHKVDYSGLKGINILNDCTVIYLPTTKGKKERFVPISKHLRPLLLEYFEYRGVPDPDEYVFINLKGRNKFKAVIGYTVWKNFSRYCRLANIPKTRTIHGMRHQHITGLIEKGFSFKEAAEFAGHSSSKVTEQTYTHLAFKRLEEKYRRLEEED